jgi:hypothetical protein
MKKLLSMMLLFTAMSLMFSACSDSGDDVDTTYTVVFDVNTSLSTTIHLFECNDNGEKIGNRSAKFKSGDSHTFTAEPGASKVKVYIGDLVNKWVQQVFILKKGGDTRITIDGETLVGKNEP